MNETLQYAIIAFILAGCIYFTVKSFRNRSRRGGSQCAGCSIKDTCQSQHKTKKPNDDTGCHQNDCCRRKATAGKEAT